MNEIERAAVELAIRYETAQGREVTYVGDGIPVRLNDEVNAWAGQPQGVRNSCDLVSRGSNGDIERLIEVKGKGKGYGSVSSSFGIIDRQRETMLRLGSKWWLYVALDCWTDSPTLVAVEDPARLPWSQLRPAAVIPEGRPRRPKEEADWHAFASDALAIGVQVTGPLLPTPVSSLADPVDGSQ